MRNEEGRALLLFAVGLQQALNQADALCIKIRGGFIQQQGFGLNVQHTQDRQPLSFSARCSIDLPIHGVVR